MQKNYTAKPYSARGILSILLPLLAIPALVFLLQIPWAPGNSSLSNDSGLFAYFGRRILQGARLYVDIFDHKTPGIYYLNAFALKVFGDSLWSIWVLQNLWASITTVILYFTLRRHLNPVSAFIGIIFFLFTLHYPDYYQSGNLTEFYSLLPQVLGLLAISAFEKNGGKRWLVLLGLSTGLAILFKPTYFGIGLAGSLAIGMKDIFQRNWKSLLEHAFFVVLGLLIPILGVVLISLSSGNLRELWYSAIVFNIRYSEQGMSLRNIYGTLRKLFLVPPLSYLNTLSAGAAGLFLVRFLYRWNNDQQKTPAESDSTGTGQIYPNLFWMSIFLGLIIESGLVFVSGRFYGHYFMTPLPVVVASSAFLIHHTPKMLERIRSEGSNNAVALTLILILSIAWGIETSVKNLPSPGQIRDFITSPFPHEFNRGLIVDYITANSEPDESIYIWDDHAEILFLSNRSTPTKIPYATHLLLPGIDHAAAFNELILELENNPPRLILSQTQSGVGLPYLGGPVTELCTSIPADACPGLLELRAFLDDDYELGAEIGTWRIFERTP